MSRKFAGIFSIVGFTSLLCGLLLFSQAGVADEAATVIKQGKEIVVDRKKGNCVACHIIEDEELPGTNGPPLIFMKQRFPDKQKLRERIYDPTAFNPNSLMPPFGRHGILTPEEIDKVVEYIYSL